MSKPSISQFVSRVIAFSSQYTSLNGGVNNLIGPPKCLNKYGDNANAWCPARFNGHEFVEVEFELEVYVERLKFYENLNGGCIVRVEAFVGGKYVLLWKRARAEIKRSYNIFDICPQDAAVTKFFRTRQLKIFLDCTSLRYYTQMDAIELIGVVRKTIHSDSQLSTHMIKLLRSEEFTDLDVYIWPTGSRSPIRVHRSILHARARPLFDYIVSHRRLDEQIISYEEFHIVVEFIYSGRFEFCAFERLVEGKKTSAPTSNEWMLISNRLIRFANRFKVDEMAELLLEHLVINYLQIDTLASILIDACGNQNYDDHDVRRLDAVEAECFKFIRNNLESCVKCGCFNEFSKDILLRIIQNCFYFN